MASRAHLWQAAKPSKYRAPAGPLPSEHIDVGAQRRVYHEASQRWGYMSARRNHLGYVEFDGGDKLWVNRSALRDAG